MNTKLNEQELAKKREADLINEALNDPNRNTNRAELDTFIDELIKNSTEK